MEFVNMKRKSLIIRIFSALALIALALSMLPVTVLAAENADLITTRAEFEIALAGAKNGDTLLVGDIDFNLPYTGAVNVTERLTIDKSITVKSGKSDGNAVFKGASFNLFGSMIAGEVSSFTFERITFDEGLDTSALTNEDWVLAYDSLGEPISFYPLKSQYAIEFRGNANASFVGCEFKGYMHDYGAAIRAYYGDYTMTPSLEAEHGDNVPCRLNIDLTDCGFSSNAALYGGGAVFIQASNKNVTLNADGCSFTGNRSGFTYNSVGGGAIYTQNAVVNFNNCSFAENDANYFYGGERVTSDQLRGGAVYASTKSELTMRSCKVIGNKASEGGGIAVTESTAVIEDCTIADNKAIPETEDKQSMYGIASNQGLGGAIYLNGSTKVTVGNTEIRGNYAENAFGAIFTNYDLLNDYSTYSAELLFCTIADNVCGTKMTDYTGYGEDRWLWFSYYTDFFDISYLEYYGNLVIDELYETHNPKSEMPTEENGYNFFGSEAPEEWYEEGQILHGPVISTDNVKEKLGDRNYYGTFTVGANNQDVTFRFFADGECRHTVTLPSGVAPDLPELQKSGYTLTSWKLAENFDYGENRPFIIGNKTESVDIYAVYTPNTYTVTFDFGYNTTEALQVYGEALALPEAIDRSGYKFIGWFTASDGEGEQLTDGALFTTAENVTYFAYYHKSFPVLPIVLVTVFALFAAIGLVIYRRRRSALVPPAVPIEQPTENTEAVPRIVKTRYTDEEIEKIVAATDETNLLTNRELEVFRELLKGRKQSEIGYYLGISISTVKDNSGRIYSKFGVANKSELFEMIDSKLRK